MRDDEGPDRSAARHEGPGRLRPVAPWAHRTGRMAETLAAGAFLDAQLAGLRSREERSLLFADCGQEYLRAHDLTSEAARRSWERLLGPEQPRLATSLQNLAIVYLHLERPDEATPLAARAATIFERSLGVDSPDAVRARKVVQTARAESR